MIHARPARPHLVLALVALAAAVLLAGAPPLHGQSADGAVVPPAPLDALALRDGPPPCMGYTIDDPCITPQALAECRRAVKQCGDDPVAVILTCPLQFSCGR